MLTLTIFDIVQINQQNLQLDKHWLIERLKYSTRKVEVVQLAKSFVELGVKPDELIALSLHPVESVRFHSAWVLENILLRNLQELDYYLLDIVNYLPKVKSDSVKRHFTKLVAIGVNRIVNKKASKVFEKIFWSNDLEPLEEVCFKWFFDNEMKNAVKVHCLEILFLLSTREKWIAEELPYIIENQISSGSPSVRARGREVLRRLSLNQSR
ncbi:MAG: hypothetical protein PHD06_05005 [Bacteroidales bacterium]|mgnify:CR=1 FL=1|jgi:hypothetical protein|nr:hypothetical protein [Bacteroidales bacterium]MDD4384519.1 hypothetical protein [Bacteroidales bacterium]MDY0196923.1 hypothetical protein [Tenuifilaceae bacterium]